MKKTLAFIGIGLMGQPMATHLINAEYPLYIFNRTKEKCQGLAKLGATIAASPRECAQHANIIMLCVTNENATDEILFGPQGIVDFEQQQELVIIDHSTIGTQAVADITNKLKGSKIHYIDAPITGGVPGAEQGNLTTFCGGDQNSLDSAREILQCYCNQVIYLGKSGTGQATKICNQTMVFNTVYAIYEMLALAKAQGIEMEAFLKCFDNSLFDSKLWQFILQSELNPDFTKTLELKTHMKDLEYIHQTAAQNNSPIPITSTTTELVRMLMKKGYADEDPRRCIHTLFE